MNNINYRDIIVLPGEDTAHVLSILFSSIHGCQRSRGENKLGVVPILVENGFTYVWGKDGKLPNGFRVFSESIDNLEFSVSPRIDDAVKIKKIKTVPVLDDVKFLTVRRLRDINASCIRRLSKRNPDKVYDTVNMKLSVKKDKYILMDAKQKYPMFFGFDIVDSKDIRFEVKNSYGFCTVPLIDFQ